MLHADDGVARQHQAEGAFADRITPAPAIDEGLFERVRAGNRCAGDQMEFLRQMRFDFALAGHRRVPADRVTRQHHLARQRRVQPVQHGAGRAQRIDHRVGFGRAVQIRMEGIAGLAEPEVIGADDHIALTGQVRYQRVIALGIADVLGHLIAPQRLRAVAPAEQGIGPLTLRASRYQHRGGGRGRLAVDTNGGIGEFGQPHIAFGLFKRLVVFDQHGDHIAWVTAQEVAVQ